MKDKLKQQYLQINRTLNIEIDAASLFLRPRLHLVQLMEPLEDWDFCIHTHTSYELIIPVKNTYKCSLNHQELNVSPGSFLMIQPGQIHQDFYTKDAPFRGIQFYLDCTEKTKLFPTLFQPDFPPQKQIAPLPAFSARICDLLFDAVSSKQPDTVCDALFGSLFWGLTESYQQDLLQKTDARNSENVLLHRINRLFQEFVENGKFSMSRLQCEFHVCRRTLDYIFYRLFHNPPAKQFRIFRCQLVRKFLLEHPESSLKDTAALFHFNDRLSMSSDFRKVYGYPPSKVLKSVTRPASS